MDVRCLRIGLSLTHRWGFRLPGDRAAEHVPNVQYMNKGGNKRCPGICLLIYFCLGALSMDSQGSSLARCSGVAPGVSWGLTHTAWVVMLSHRSGPLLGSPEDSSPSLLPELFERGSEG